MPETPDAKTAYVVLDQDGEARTFEVYGPFATEHDARDFGATECRFWDVMPLIAVPSDNADLERHSDE